MEAGIYVPIILLVILIVIAVLVVLIKGIDFTKSMLEWAIISFLSYMIILVVLNIGFPNLWTNISEKYVVYVMGLFNVGMTLPLTVILKFMLRPLFKFLRYTKVIGGR